jgi:hypothetical protein
VKIEDVYGIRVFLAAPSAADDEQIIVRQADAKANQNAEELTEPALGGAGLIIKAGAYVASLCYAITAPARRAPGA